MGGGIGYVGEKVGDNLEKHPGKLNLFQAVMI